MTPPTDKLSSDLSSLRIDRTHDASGAHVSFAPTRQRAQSRGLWLVAALGLLLLVAAFSLARRGHMASGAVATASSPPAAAIPGASGPRGLLSASGYAVARRTAKLSSRITGRVAAVHTSLGAKVSAGDVLFELAGKEDSLQASAAQARAVAARSRVDVVNAQLFELSQSLERDTALRDKGVLAPAGVADLARKVATQEAQVRATRADAEAAAREAQVRAATLDELRVHAPFDGMVLTQPAAEGELATPQVTLVELLDPSSVVVEAEVPEAQLRQVQDDGPCELVFDAEPARSVTGSVRRVLPRVDRAKATAMVEIALVSMNQVLVRPGMAARVTFQEKRP